MPSSKASFKRMVGGVLLLLLASSLHLAAGQGSIPDKDKNLTEYILYAIQHPTTDVNTIPRPSIVSPFDAKAVHDRLTGNDTHNSSVTAAAATAVNNRLGAPQGALPVTDPPSELSVSIADPIEITPGTHWQQTITFTNFDFSGASLDIISFFLDFVSCGEFLQFGSTCQFGLTSCNLISLGTDDTRFSFTDSLTVKSNQGFSLGFFESVDLVIDIRVVVPAQVCFGTCFPNQFRGALLHLNGIIVQEAASISFGFEEVKVSNWPYVANPGTSMLVPAFLPPSPFSTAFLVCQWPGISVFLPSQSSSDPNTVFATQGTFVDNSPGSTDTASLNYFVVNPNNFTLFNATFLIVSDATGSAQFTTFTVTNNPSVTAAVGSGSNPQVRIKVPDLSIGSIIPFSAEVGGFSGTGRVGIRISDQFGINRADPDLPPGPFGPPFPSFPINFQMQKILFFPAPVIGEWIVGPTNTIFVESAQGTVPLRFRLDNSGNAFPVQFSFNLFDGAGSNIIPIGFSFTGASPNGCVGGFDSFGFGIPVGQAPAGTICDYSATLTVSGAGTLVLEAFNRFAGSATNPRVLTPNFNVNAVPFNLKSPSPTIVVLGVCKPLSESSLTLPGVGCNLKDDDCTGGVDELTEDKSKPYFVNPDCQAALTGKWVTSLAQAEQVLCDALQPRDDCSVGKDLKLNVTLNNGTCETSSFKVTASDKAGNQETTFVTLPYYPAARSPLAVDVTLSPTTISGLGLTLAPISVNITVSNACGKSKPTVELTVCSDEGYLATYTKEWKTNFARAVEKLDSTGALCGYDLALQAQAFKLCGPKFSNSCSSSVGGPFSRTYTIFVAVTNDAGLRATTSKTVTVTRRVRRTTEQGDAAEDSEYQLATGEHDDKHRALAGTSSGGGCRFKLLTVSGVLGQGL